MTDPLVLSDADAAAALPLWLVDDANWASLRDALSPAQRAWVAAHDFRPERGRLLVLPGPDGAPAGALAAALPPKGGALGDPWLAAQLAERLPPAAWRLSPPPASAAWASLFTFGWLYGQYRFTRYRKAAAPAARLVAPALADVPLARAQADASRLARDLINTPASDLGPAELAAAAAELAAAAGGSCEIHGGPALHEAWPLVAAVGRGSPRAARVIELRFPRAGAPRLVVVGKGVCFDTGGLDIKPSSGMLLMKKDMGGAACALGFAQLLRRMDAPVDLRVLIPAVENSVDGHSFRPGDVLASRKGLSVEVGNTDAEGRLVLADALAAAGEGAPDLVVDLATLTGAARVALGPELPAVFSGDPELAATLATQGRAVADPLWPLPLWDGYDEDLASRIADLGNVASGGFAGAIMGALFLRRFVADPTRWLHVDLYAWNAKDRPGRPVGAEAQVIRALYALVRQRWG